MIRDAVSADIPRLVVMGDQFLTQTAYGGHIVNNPHQMAHLCQQLIDAPDCALFVADQGDEVIGMIGLVSFAHHVSGQRIAGEVFWWADPAHRGTTGLRLLKRAERWAREQGATAMQMIAPTDRVGQLYRALGYAPVETTYQRAL